MNTFIATITNLNNMNVKDLWKECVRYKTTEPVLFRASMEILIDKLGGYRRLYECFETCVNCRLDDGDSSKLNEDRKRIGGFKFQALQLMVDMWLDNQPDCSVHPCFGCKNEGCKVDECFECENKSCRQSPAGSRNDQSGCG